MNRKYILTLGAVTVFCSILFFGIVYSDSKIYIHLTRYFLGISPYPPAGWLSARPLIPLIASPLATVLWIPIAYGVVNIILWIGSTFLTYFITLEITRSRNIAFNASILLCVSPPALLYFGSVMLEAGSTFFTLLILWLYLQFIKSSNNIHYYVLSILSGIGLLAKESTLPVVISILLLSLVNKNLRKTILYVIFLVLPVICWQIFTTFWIGENYWTHYLRAGLQYSQERYGVLFYADLVDISKAIALSHFPFAILALIIGFFNLNDRRQNLIFYSLLIPAFISYLLWPFRDLRIGVVTFYATMPLAGIGLEEIIKALYSKPFLNTLSINILRITIYVLNLTLSILYVYYHLGRFSPPWDIYVFAESSLQAGIS